MSRARRIVDSDDEVEIMTPQVVLNRLDEEVQEAVAGPSRRADLPGTVRQQQQVSDFNLIDIVLMLYQMGLTTIGMWEDSIEVFKQKTLNASLPLTARTLFHCIAAFVQILKSKRLVRASRHDNQMAVLEEIVKDLSIDDITATVSGVQGAATKQFGSKDFETVWQNMQNRGKKRTLTDVLKNEQQTRVPYTYEQNLEWVLDETDDVQKVTLSTNKTRGDVYIHVESFNTIDIEGLSFKDRYGKAKSRATIVLDRTKDADLIDDYNSLLVRFHEKMKRDDGAKVISRKVARVDPNLK